MNNWKSYFIEDIQADEPRSLVSGPFGSNISSKFFVERGIPVIRGNNLSLGKQKYNDNGYVFITSEKAHELRNCNAVAKDIIFTAAGSLGQVGIIPESSKFSKYIISNKQLRLRCNQNVAYPLFVYYFFANPSMIRFVKNQNTGSSVPLLTLGKLKKFSISLPPIPIQRKIAAILSTYDDLIENNTRRIGLLENTAQEIYREWFVRYRFPGHENVSFVNSTRGKIPKEWKVQTLGDILSLNYGKALKADQRIPGEIPVYGSGGIVGYHNNPLVTTPAIIVGRKGNVGSIFLSETPFYPIDTVFYVVSNWSNYFLKFLLEQQEFLNSDAAVPGLNRNYALSKRIVSPSKNTIDLFHQHVTEIFNHKAILTKANTNLRRTRDLLLPRLMSGEIDVEQLDIDTTGLDD